MEISTELNREFYARIRKKGYLHQEIIDGIFPPERKVEFENDVKDLKDSDFSTKSKPKSKKSKKKK